jgi:methionyl-tRNA formyltransferase
MVVIEETGVHTKTRVRYEVKRIGWLRFLDVLAFRLYYGLRLDRADSAWMTAQLDALDRRFGPLPATMEVLRTDDPSSPEVAQFLQRLAPDFMLARCKRILKERVFAVPRHGTFVMHPGVCPEYRNAHGAFWALANDDLANVGLTLIRIDKGVDTGPVYGYYTCDFDEVRESHIVIMTRLALDNLDAIRDKLLDVMAGRAATIDTTGRASGVWGQPWLTRYLRWKRQAKRRRDARAVARVP